MKAMRTVQAIPTVLAMQTYESDAYGAGDTGNSDNATR
jgi:hypothetical protein